MADKKDNAPSNDKSIDDLLQEYAGDVKGNDLDDFLKHDDAFESEDADTSEEGEKIMAESEGKSGGFLTMAFIVLAFGAAGAGAYMYMNKDDGGMTSIMGGFDAPAQTADATAPTPEAAPMMPAPIEEPAETLAPLDAPDQPTPIANDMPPSDDGLAMPEMAPPESMTAAAEVTPMPAPTETTTAETPVPAADTSAAQAVDAWQSGTDTMDAPAVTDSTAPLPEKVVDEVKAKPAKAAEAAPKKREYSTMDDALSPPFVAIKEEKKAEAKAAPEKTAEKAPEKTAEAAPKKRVERPEDAAYIPPAKGKMAPVVEGSAPVASARNANESDVTKATGDTAKLIAQGGGRIDLPASGASDVGVPAPVSADAMAPAPVAQPEMRTTGLAISGGRSMPDGTVVQSRTYAQLPNTDQGTKPAEAPVAEAAAPVTRKPSGEQTAQDMEAEEARAIGMVKAVPPTPEAQAPAPTPTPAPAPVATGSSDTDAKAVVAQAMAAEKSGDKKTALALFQKALEVDAVYGNGSSIDRGMVYDRIGSLRAGS